MTSRIVPEIEIVDDDTLITRRTPYVPGYPVGLKEIVSPGNYAWDPSTKEWTITGAHHFEAVIAFTRRCFPTVRVIDHRHPVDAGWGVATLAQDYAQLGLLPIAKPRIVRVVYRELAKEVHPDSGGSHEAMLALNASYERLREAGAA